MGTGDCFTFFNDDIALSRKVSVGGWRITMSTTGNFCHNASAVPLQLFPPAYYLTYYLTLMTVPFKHTV